MAIQQVDIGRHVSGQPFTYRDLEGTPDDGRVYELSYGILIVSPGANTNHQMVATQIARLLDDHLLPNQVILVEAELRIRDDTVKRPDVQVVDRALVGGQDITGTPVLVVEVASPSTTMLDRTEKRAVYAEAGIPAYWLVDPVAHTVTVLELVDGTYVEQARLDERGRCTVTSPTTFELDASALFA
jgi:Uma2 family endonuclease